MELGYRMDHRLRESHILQFTDSDAHSPITVPIAVGNHSGAGIGWRTKYRSGYGRCYSLEIEQEGR